MQLDRVLAVYHFHETHSVAIEAPPNRGFGAVRQVTLSEVPLFRALFTLRALPRTVLGKPIPAFDPHEPLVSWAMRAGFLMLAQVPDQEFVFGLIGQPWKLVGGRSANVGDVEEFMTFAAPGFVKVATNFWLEARAPASGTVLTTETRVWASDPTSRARFAWYWRFIHPGSAIIRREWLRAIKRRAEGKGVAASGRAGDSPVRVAGSGSAPEIEP